MADAAAVRNRQCAILSWHDALSHAPQRPSTVNRLAVIAAIEPHRFICRLPDRRERFFGSNYGTQRPSHWVFTSLLRWAKPRESIVPIDPLLAQEAFDPETTALLASAFDTAWDTIQCCRSSAATADGAESTREQLAKYIIATARDGERDPHRLVERALPRVAMPPTARQTFDACGSTG